MAEAFIIDACRTPRGIGRVGKGALAHLHPQTLGAAVLSALRDRNSLDTSEVDDIVWGTSSQKGKQSSDLGRMSALDAGYDVRASGVTLDRFCGSGISSVSLAAGQVMAGFEDLVIGGGTEMMSYTSATADPNDPPMMDAGNLHLRHIHPQSHQGVCADAIATLDGIDRETLDALAVESQKRAAAAITEGRFNQSVVPVYSDDGSVLLDQEEFPRPQTTLGGLRKLNVVFDKFADISVGENGETYGNLIQRKYPEISRFNHVHHAGNSSGVVDGAAAVLIASEDYTKRNNLTPRARIVTSVNMGDCPTLMLNAPVPAAEKALGRAGLKKDDIDVWEINEAFAVVAERFMEKLDLDRSKVNVNGGAIALGHPIGATGSILIGTALDELERSSGRYGLVTMCAGGGMAPAIIIERL